MCLPGAGGRLLVMNEFVVEMTNVSKRYGSVVAVQSMTLRIAQGEVFGVLGPNGRARILTRSVSGSACSCSRPCCPTG